LLGHRDPAVRDLADRLGRLVDVALAAIPEPDAALAAAAPPVPVPAAGPLPGWMNAHAAMPGAAAGSVPTASVSTESAPNAFAPAASVPAARSTPPAFPPLAPPAAFAGRRTADIVLVPCLMLLLLVAAVTAAVVLPLAAPVAVLAAACVPVYGRARRPEVRSARAHVAATRARLVATPDPEAALAEVARERADADRTEQTRKDRVRLQHHQLTQRLQRTHARIQSDLARDSAAVAHELADLRHARQRAHANTLDTVRAEWIRQRLRQHRIADARLKGVGAVSIGHLEAAGIRTAADFTGAGYPPNAAAGTADALLVLPDGRMVDVPNVGKLRAEALVAWRDGIVRRVSPDAPKRVSQADLDAIDRRFEQRRRQLEADLRQRTDAAAHDRDDATARTNAERAQIADQDRAAKEHAQRRTAEFARRAADIRAREPEFRRLTADAAYWRDHLKSLSHARYLRFALTGG
ncbi:MAG: hypothetical protein HOV68_28680, partial [Streptomycetaceae bacterium]|nr:hypothetical protein [Streptomycetaceae bacterium]